MDRHTLEQFRTRARKVTLPEDVRESVLDEIRVEKGERARGPRRPRRERQGVTRRTFVRAGAVAAGGVAGLDGIRKFCPNPNNGCSLGVHHRSHLRADHGYKPGDNHTAVCRTGRNRAGGCAGRTGGYSRHHHQHNPGADRHHD